MADSTVHVAFGSAEGGAWTIARVPELALASSAPLRGALITLAMHPCQPLPSAVQAPFGGTSCLFEDIDQSQGPGPASDLEWDICGTWMRDGTYAVME